ncbi:MAG: ComF family protein [Bacteroidales bacterium]
MTKEPFLDDFIALLYPRICAGCSATLYRQERWLCSRCLYHLPRTNFHRWRNNPVEMIFWGRVPVQYATAGFYFHKKGRFQKIVHEFKYRGGKELGQELGRIIGYDLAGSCFTESSLIVPVPLHISKLRKRGYNQSECIARGLSEVMDRPLDLESLQRAVPSSTQTRKSRFERWKNVEEIFCLRNPECFSNQHVLLVDDVVTTGATLEACAGTVLQSANSRVSIVTLAVA